MVPTQPVLAPVATTPRAVSEPKPQSAPTTPGDTQRRGAVRNVLELRLGALATSLDKGEIMMMGRCGSGCVRDVKGEGEPEEEVDALTEPEKRSRSTTEDVDGRESCQAAAEVEEDAEDGEEAETSLTRMERLQKDNDVEIEGLVFCPGGEIDLSALMC